jgi:hypothetical protein
VTSDYLLTRIGDRMAELEGKLQTTINENAATNLIHEQELNKLRSAHTKSLEMLMSYQEENELLRSAVSSPTFIFSNQYPSDV